MVERSSNDTDLTRIERPDPSLLNYYMVRAVLSGPFIVVMLPLLFFRYQTLRYRFDEEGVHMKVGILFRKEVNLAYSRIQDLHLRSGVIQRWFGLADVLVQTASGNAGAEMIIEGFPQFEQIRDYLYSRMRGAKDGQKGETKNHETSTEESELSTILYSICDELRRTRELLDEHIGRHSEPESALLEPRENALEEE